ncbi:MAG: carotenoid biosynthesis protein [Myxococcales bacterium]|nr:carotenoid biosynthesis protein [Myxococcales bacterium]
MYTLELVCLGIVALYIAVRLSRRGDESPAALLTRFAWLSLTSALGEDSMIRVHGFYDYAPGWSLPIDRVPLLIVLIWPIVIDSASVLAGGLGAALGLPPRTRTIAILTAAVVFVDAWLIEPIATQSGLWRWHEPGLFGVPPIGVLGWAVFAGCVVWLRPFYDRPGPSAASRLVRMALASLLALCLTHAVLIASWWGLLRWLSRSLPAHGGIIAAWALLGSLALWFCRTRSGRFVPLADLLVRVPAAAFFFVLLVVRKAELGAQRGPLLIYALAFALPYWVLVLFRRSPPAFVEK